MKKRIKLLTANLMGFAVLFLLGAHEITQGQPNQWQVIFSSSEVPLFQVHYVDRLRGIATSTTQPVDLYGTDDGGFTWQPLLTAANFVPNYYGIEFYNDRIGYLCAGNRSASTADGGQHWTIHDHDWDQSAERVAYIDSTRMVGVAVILNGEDPGTRMIYRSEDGGANWLTVYEETTIPGFHNVVSLSESLQVVVSQRWSEVWRSTDQGLTWSLDSHAPISISEMCSPAPNEIIAVGFTLPGWCPAISRSTDGGLEWSIVFSDSTLCGTTLNDVSFPDSLHGWVVGDDGIVVQTSDGGVTWSAIFLDSNISFMTSVCFVDSANGWAVVPPSSGTRIFRYGDPRDAGERRETGLPNSQLLIEAFPNPFNSSTSIRFSIPRTGDVDVTIYDLTGREVKQLTNEKLTAGTHDLRWNPGSLTSGIYFCRIEWNLLIRQTTKLVYLR